MAAIGAPPLCIAPKISWLSMTEYTPVAESAERIPAGLLGVTAVGLPLDVTPRRFES